MLADTRVPASCTCDIPPLHGQYPLGSDNPCQATALVSLLPSGGNAYVGQDGCHPNCSRVQPHPRSHSRNCSWSLRLLLLTTGICRSAANPASTAAPWPPAGVPPPAAPPLTPDCQASLQKGLLPELRSQDKVVPSTEAGGRLFVSCRVNTAPLYRILLSHVSVLLPRVLLDHMYATCHSTVVASLVMSARNFFLRWTLYLLPQGHILWLFKKRTGVKTVLLNIPPVPGR